MKDVEQQWQQQTQAAEIVRALLNEFGASTEYRVLRDSLPRSLATLLKCRCVLLYQRMGETLQLVADFCRRTGVVGIAAGGSAYQSNQFKWSRAGSVCVA